MKKNMQARRCQKFIPVFLSMITALKESPFKRLATLGKTLYEWQEEVVQMWRFSKEWNNGRLSSKDEVDSKKSIWISEL